MTSVRFACFFVMASVAFTSNAMSTLKQDSTNLPVDIEAVFKASMQDPNVLFYFAESAYRRGDRELALTHFLEASKYNHEPSVKNAKFMIAQKMVTGKNHAAVIDFLLYQARPGTKPEPFITSLLANYYHGNACLFSECAKSDSLLSTWVDYEKSYYFHSLAADAGDLKSSYIVGMMDLTGIGTAKNPALALARFEQSAAQGSAHSAYLSAKILQGISGVLPDPQRAAELLSTAAGHKHPLAMLELASIRHREGAQYASEEKLTEAVRLYSDVAKNVLSSESQRVTAKYEWAQLLQGNPNVQSPVGFLELMNEVAASTVPGVATVRANIYLGDLHTERRLSDALVYYTKAADMLLQLPVLEQQKNADVWQKMAAVYGKGDDSLDRSELQYSKHMTMYRSVLSKTPEPGNSDAGKVFGYHVFTYPGL